MSPFIVIAIVVGMCALVFALIGLARHTGQSAGPRATDGGGEAMVMSDASSGCDGADGGAGGCD